MDALQDKPSAITEDKTLWKLLIEQASPPILLFFAAIFSVVYQGFNYGSNNNALQIPILQRAAHPELYPGDPYVATLDNYFSLFWWFLSRFSGVDDWPKVFLALHIATRWLTLLAFFALLRLVVSSPPAALAATAILGVSVSLAGGSPVGCSELLMDYFNHSHIAAFLVLFAFALALRGRPYRGAIVAGLAFDINAFMGAWTLFSLLVLAITADSANWPRRMAGSFLQTALFLLAASPTLNWILSSTSAGSANYPSFDYRDYLREYFPNHFLIDEASLRSLLRLCLISLCGAAAIYLLPRFSKPIGIIFASLIALFLAGCALPFVTANPLLLNLHLLRVDGYLLLLSALASAGVAVERLSAPAGHRQTRFAAVAMLMGLVLGHWAVTAAGLALCLREKTWSRPGLALVPAGIVLACALFSIGDTALPVPADTSEITAATAYLLVVGLLYWVFPVHFITAFALPGIAGFAATSWAAAGLTMAALLTLIPWVLPDSRRSGRVESVASAVAVAACALGALGANGTAGPLFFLAGAALGLIAWNRPSRLPIRGQSSRTVAAILAAFIGVLTVPVVAERAYRQDLETKVHWFPPGGSWREKQSAWRAVQVWARRNTPADAVFLIPFRHVDIGFGVFSERSIWVDWKQGGAVPWAPAYYWVWKARQEAQFQAENPRQFGRENRVSFAVVPAREIKRVLPKVDWDTWAKLKVAYRNQEFTVYDLRE